MRLFSDSFWLLLYYFSLCSSVMQILKKKFLKNDWLIPVTSGQWIHESTPCRVPEGSLPFVIEICGHCCHMYLNEAQFYSACPVSGVSLCRRLNHPQMFNSTCLLLRGFIWCVFWLETFRYFGLCVADSIRSEEITQDLISEYVRLHTLRVIEFETWDLSWESQPRSFHHQANKSQIINE